MQMYDNEWIKVWDHVNNPKKIYSAGSCFSQKLNPNLFNLFNSVQFWIEDQMNFHVVIIRCLTINKYICAISFSQFKVRFLFHSTATMASFELKLCIGLNFAKHFVQKNITLRKSSAWRKKAGEIVVPMKPPKILGFQLTKTDRINSLYREDT